MWIRIQFRFQGFDDQKLYKITAVKPFLYILDQKLQFRYLSSGLHKGLLQEKASALKREHPALQNMKILNFFLYLWVIFALLDPDPATQINTDPCGSVSTTLCTGTGIKLIRCSRSNFFLMRFWILGPFQDQDSALEPYPTLILPLNFKT